MRFSISDRALARADTETANEIKRLIKELNSLKISIPGEKNYNLGMSDIMRIKYKGTKDIVDSFKWLGENFIGSRNGSAQVRAMYVRKSLKGGLSSAVKTGIPKLKEIKGPGGWDPILKQQNSDQWAELLGYDKINAFRKEKAKYLRDNPNLSDKEKSRIKKAMQRGENHSY